MNDYQFYFKFYDNGEMTELFRDYNGYYVKFEGLLEDGEISNIYKEEYADAPMLRVYIPPKEDIVHKQTNVTLTVLWKMNFPDEANRNLLTNTEIQRHTTAQTGYDWILFCNDMITTVDLVQGQKYTIRAKSNGIWTDNHNTDIESDNVTLWLVSETSGSFLVSDSNTGDTKGTTFTFIGKTGKYYIRFNSYGKVKTLSEVMLVEGGKIAKKYEAAPEEWDSVTEQEQNFYNSVKGRLIEYHDTFRNKYWEILLTQQPKFVAERLYGGQQFREVSYTFTNVFGTSFSESQVGKIDLYDFGSKEIK